MKRQLLSPVAAAVAALFCAAVHAESLIYVTPSQYGLIDSANPGADITPGGSPIRYSLPAGYAVVGIDVDAEVGALRLLARSGSTCQLFTNGQNGVAGLSTTDSPFDCTSSSGDIDFADNDGNQAVYDYAAAAGSQVYRLLHANGSSNVARQSIQVIGLAGQTPNLVAVSFPPAGVTGNYGIDAASNALVILTPDRAGNPTQFSESAPLNLGFSVTGSTSLDQSAVSSRLYLFTRGNLYGITPSAGQVSSLGAPPAGTLAVAVTKDAFGDSRNTVSTPQGNVVFTTSAGQIQATTSTTPVFAPGGYIYPVGFFSYNVVGLTQGQTISVSISVPAGISLDSLIKCNTSACGPYGFRDGSGTNQLTLSLTDGGSDDADGQANGTISDPLAPAISTGSTTGGTSTGTTGGGTTGGTTGSTTGGTTGGTTGSTTGGTTGGTTGATSAGTTGGTTGGTSNPSSGGGGAFAFPSLIALAIGLVLRSRRTRIRIKGR